MLQKRPRNKQKTETCWRHNTTTTRERRIESHSSSGWFDRKQIESESNVVCVSFDQASVGSLLDSILTYLYS